VDSMAGESGGLAIRAVRSGNPRFRRYLLVGGVIEVLKMVTAHRRDESRIHSMYYLL
jgi:hypothetical protein